MSESTGKKSKLKGCVEAIGIIGGILGIITSIIVIYQFVSGNISIASVFHLASVPLLAPPPFVPILYDSLWTWLWWAGSGALSGGLTGGIRSWVSILLWVSDGKSLSAAYSLVLLQELFPAFS